MLASSAIAGPQPPACRCPLGTGTPCTIYRTGCGPSPEPSSNSPSAVDGDGYVNETAATEPDVSLELPLSSLPKALTGGADALMADIRISGNADFADTLGFVFRQLRWDGEEALAKLIGDIAAHRAVMTAQNIIGWQRQAARNVVDNLVEYYSEERAMLVKHQALEELASANAKLRDDLARLEKRLNKLETTRLQTTR